MKMRDWCAIAALSGLCAASGALMGASPEHAVDSHAPAHAAPTPAGHAADAPAPAQVTHSNAAPEVTPDDALKNLIEGNERYLSSLAEHPHSNAERRCDTFTDGQH